MINIVALTMPWIEIVCGIFLIVGFRLKANAFIAGGMLVVFNVAVLYAMSLGLNIDCGCFSERATMVGWTKLGENMLTIILALYVYFYPVKSLTLEKFALSEA
jgi:uncharacterized membrane protein YphA (DoxX/SURF4 family)